MLKRLASLALLIGCGGTTDPVHALAGSYRLVSVNAVANNFTDSVIAIPGKMPDLTGLGDERWITSATLTLNGDGTFAESERDSLAGYCYCGSPTPQFLWNLDTLQASGSWGASGGVITFVGGRWQNGTVSGGAIDVYTLGAGTYHYVR